MKGQVMTRGMIFIVLFSLFVPVSGCHKKTETDRVKEVITSIQNAGQKKDIGKIMGHLSKKYGDQEGNDYNSIKGFLLAYFFRHQKIHVLIPGIEVTMEDSGARAVFHAVLSGGSPDGSLQDLLPEALGMYAFDVLLRKENGDWKVQYASWNRMQENR